MNQGAPSFLDPCWSRGFLLYIHMFVAHLVDRIQGLGFSLRYI